MADWATSMAKTELEQDRKAAEKRVMKLIPPIREDWQRAVFNTRKPDEATVTSLVYQLYDKHGKRPPENIMYVESPRALTQAVVSIPTTVSDRTRHKNRKDMRRACTNVAMRIRFRPNFLDNVKNKLWGSAETTGLRHENPNWARRYINEDRIIGNVVAPLSEPHGLGSLGYRGAGTKHWAALLELFAAAYPSSVSDEHLVQVELAKRVGWWWASGTTFIYCGNPSKRHYNKTGTLHCDFEPAIVYPDGWGEFVWSGTIFPGEWLREGALTAQQALRQTNQELRRTACEIIGWHVILDQIDAQIVDKHPNPLIGTLYEAHVDRSPGNFWAQPSKFLKVKCGTGRTFAMQVPSHFTSAHEANAWLWDKSASEYRPEVET